MRQSCNTGWVAARPILSSTSAPEDRDRPVAARSVVASVLLPLDPPELAGQSLVRCTALFGIAEGTCRVALSRMVAAGELQVAAGRYRLTGHLLRRQARQRQARHPQLLTWSGRWHLGVVDSGRRSAGERALLRAELRRLQMAEWREGVWLRPDNVPGWEQAVAGISPTVAGHCGWSVGSLVPAAGEAPAQLAQRLWEVRSWAAEAHRLARRLDETEPRLERGDVSALAPGFRVAAAVVRHLTADPLLPGELLPAPWPGDEVRRRYDAYERVYRRVLRQWIAGDEAVSGGGGPLR